MHFLTQREQPGGQEEEVHMQCKLRQYSTLVVWDEQRLVECFYLPGHARKMAGRLLIRLHNEPDTCGCVVLFSGKKLRQIPRKLKFYHFENDLLFNFYFFCLFTFQFDDITCSLSDMPLLKKRTERNTCKPPGYSP